MKKSYPGFSGLISIGPYRKWSISKDEYSITINILFITIMISKKDLSTLLDSYINTMSEYMKELQTQNKKLKNTLEQYAKRK